MLELARDSDSTLLEIGASITRVAGKLGFAGDGEHEEGGVKRCRLDWKWYLLGVEVLEIF